MRRQTLDLHIHSKYSRACSKNLELPTIAATCKERGIDIVVTGDFTHPAWFSAIKAELLEKQEGVYMLADESSDTKFILGTEISCIKKHKDAVRRVHHLVFAPNIQTVERFIGALNARGCNLKADGRPIVGLTSKELREMMLEIDERMVMIPAHAWTPWFGIFGSKGGYDSLEDAFEELTDRIFAIETGLSSDPLMNAHLSRLDHITMVSNSDAHSPQKLGREANVLQFQDETSITYDEIMRVLREGKPEEFLYTIEFYPEEGKYHYDGHRDCGIVMHPKETKKHKGICPKCKKKLTIGVMHRVEDLGDREEAIAKQARRVPFKSLVPLPEVLADTLGSGVSTKKVQEMYTRMIQELGNEFFILIDASLVQIEAIAGKDIAHAIDRVRKGQVLITPGYDGVFGTVKVVSEEEKKRSGQTKIPL